MEHGAPTFTRKAGASRYKENRIKLNSTNSKDNKMRKNTLPSMILILAIIIIFSESQVVYADGFGNDLSEAGSIIQRLALCGGALGVAFSGIELAYGNEQTATKAKTRIFLILAATAAVFLLPYAIRMGQSLASGSAWSPGHLGTG